MAYVHTHDIDEYQPDAGETKTLVGRVDYGAVRDLATKGESTIRWNVSGDYLSPDGSPDLEYIDATNYVAIERARLGRPTVFLAYSHAWRVLRPDMFAYTVRASCDTLQDVAQATSAGWATVLVVPEHDPQGIIGSSVGPVRMVACVNQTARASQCDACKLCARPTVGRSSVVFTAHGSGRGRVLAVVS